MSETGLSVASIFPYFESGCDGPYPVVQQNAGGHVRIDHLIILESLCDNLIIIIIIII